ncbi:hypothetical protein BO83DRAFT_415675 [Aspergillus eucalypticola CBS 122712]|uniref:Uncharacterized protein n=1 Tax=Aspergillus eucalypticola (strain CBS 122712 / IBT 29274) TaxID=1448314 RepID=A0A317W0T9_ASPEC|nr:uncharacterized protein BO83DRAFT_415675 [Aspergillus eucalypticola CBS 122712]PWY77760.1 hypothetical protein BO83DRAFT_415675 [Aspergillus eucalypticola CBS 122712]
MFTDSIGDESLRDVIYFPVSPQRDPNRNHLPDPHIMLRNTVFPLLGELDCFPIRVRYQVLVSNELDQALALFIKAVACYIFVLTFRELLRVLEPFLDLRSLNNGTNATEKPLGDPNNHPQHPDACGLEKHSWGFNNQISHFSSNACRQSDLEADV